MSYFGSVCSVCSAISVTYVSSVSYSSHVSEVRLVSKYFVELVKVEFIISRA
jgi:hypothetical protein